jgi:hypothetical protein
MSFRRFMANTLKCLRYQESRDKKIPFLASLAARTCRPERTQWNYTYVN